jgi:DNA-binding Lrp family transcriptional regulator
MVDELDTKILQQLTKNARQSYRQIARKLRVSTGTVLTRIRRLEEMGVIRGYTIMLDTEKLGYQLTALSELVVSKGKLLEMEREIARLSSVCAVYDITGTTDAIVIAKFRNREELGNFTKSLLSMPFVERTNTHLVLTTVKEDFRTL